jgi:hypothetical protein
MKTVELIDLLAHGAGPVERHAVQKRFATAIAAGGAGALALMLAIFGVNPHLRDLISMPVFWVKIAFAAAVTAGALCNATRLAQPGVPVRHSRWLIAIPVVGLWLLAVSALAAAEPESRAALLIGHTWRTCPFNIALLSLPALAASFWALRGLAPTNLRLAAAVGGLCAGALGAFVYGFHCPEIAPPFIGIWYVIGIAIPGAIGLWLGPRLLRW